MMHNHVQQSADVVWNVASTLFGKKRLMKNKLERYVSQTIYLMSVVKANIYVPVIINLVNRGALNVIADLTTLCI